MKWNITEGSRWKPIQGGNTYRVVKFRPGLRNSVVIEREDEPKDFYEVALERMFEFWHEIKPVKESDTTGT